MGGFWLLFFLIQDLHLDLDSFSFPPSCGSLQQRWSWVEGRDVIIQLSPPLCQKAAKYQQSIFKKNQGTMMCFLTDCCVHWSNWFSCVTCHQTLQRAAPPAWMDRAQPPLTVQGCCK